MNRFSHLILCGLISGTLVVLIGCRSAPLTPRVEYDDVITHAGTIMDLAGGNYEGFFPVTNLVRYGDHGLGTFHSLDGEMIVYSGKVFRADSKGTLSLAEKDRATPFAVVTYFNADRIFDIENVDQKRFQRALEMRSRTPHLPQAIQVHGDFDSILIRSVPAQDKPWQPLNKVLERDEKRMMLTNVAGVLVGYHYPDVFGAIHPPGYHFHFVSEDRMTGGHVHDFKIKTGRISIDYTPGIQVLLSTNPPVVLPRRPGPRPVPPPASSSTQ